MRNLNVLVAAGLAILGTSCAYGYGDYPGYGYGGGYSGGYGGGYAQPAYYGQPAYYQTQARYVPTSSWQTSSWSQWHHHHDHDGDHDRDD
jgi:hypothetical protein